MNGLFEKLGITLGVILVILAILLVLPVLVAFGSVIFPIVGIITAIIFIPVAIGIFIGHIGKGGKS